VQLEFVNNRDEAIGLVGCEVFAAIANCIREMEAEWQQWNGFTVYDTKSGKIGVINQIEDYKGNMVMQVMDGKKETLISLYPELITHIDPKARILKITAPDGYFVSG
jgi:ribosomal 30S subunit maturation factor RimM